MGTLFASVYNRFLGKITDDMYMEWTREDTIRDLRNLLIDAIPCFEFPRQKLDYLINSSYPSEIEGMDFLINEQTGEVENSTFYSDLTDEEINILAIIMVNSWLQRQITTIENVRMKYSGSDFKMTSQANHLAKLLSLQTEIQRQSHHMQRLYKRRKYDENGLIKSNWSVLREVSALDD